MATDDGPAIKVAKILGVSFATAIDFLVRAYEKGMLTKEVALIKLEKLRKYGRYNFQIIQDARGRLNREVKHGSNKHKT